MGSVIATWKGRCPRRDIQSELLLFLRSLAQRHEARWAGVLPPRPRFLEIITAQREEGLPTLPEVRFFDQALTGRILVRSDVATDHRALIKEATRLGFAHEEEDAGATHSLLHLKRLRARGLDFRLFDPRGLYPGEDRMGFVFLESDDAPFLNGRLAAVTGKDFCARSRFESIRQADWYIECPYVHLRYYLEAWWDGLMAWIKFFFMPDLWYHRYEAFPGYEEVRAAFQSLQERGGYEAARAQVFGRLLNDFEAEANQWGGMLESWRLPTPESVRLVLPEWALIFHDERTRVWQDDQGDGLSLHLYPYPPSLSASLENLDAVRAAIRAQAVEAGAGLVEVDVITLDSVPAVRSIVKKPQQPTGMTYEGALLLPRQPFSFTLKVSCRETGVTGMRDAAVFLRVASEYDAPDGFPDAWFQDPYDPSFEGPALRNPADDAEWDERFPDHPLSRCRAHLRMLEDRISLKEDVKTAPAFAGPG